MRALSTGALVVIYASACVFGIHPSPAPTPRPPCQPYPGKMCKMSLCREVNNQEQCDVVNWDPVEEQSLTYAARALVAISNTSCRKSLMDTACGLLFPRCRSVDIKPVNQSMAVLVEHQSTLLLYPCPNMCLALNQTCADQLSLIPQGSEGIVRRLIGNTNMSVCARTPGFCVNVSGSDGSVECPSPLGRPNQDGFEPIPEAPYCGMPCESIVFTREEYKTAEMLLEVLAWASVLCTLIHLIERISSGESNKYPERMQLHFGGCVLMLSVGLTFNSFAGSGFGTHPQWCESANSAVCLAQAIIINYFALAVMLWWLAICVHVYLAVVVYHGKHRALDSSPALSARTPSLLPQQGDSEAAYAIQAETIQAETSRWEAHFKVFAYSFPAVVTGLLVLCEELGAGGTGAIWCWIKQDNQQWWQFAFFFIELGVVFTAGSILFALVLHHLWCKGEADRSLAQMCRSLLLMREGLLFVILIFALFFWMFAYQIEMKVEHSEFGDAYEDWIECTLKAWANSSFFDDDHAVRACPNRDKPSFAMWLAQIACVAGMGVVEFLILDLHHCIARVKQFLWPQHEMDGPLYSGSIDQNPTSNHSPMLVGQTGEHFGGCMRDVTNYSPHASIISNSVATTPRGSKCPSPQIQPCVGPMPDGRMRNSSANLASGRPNHLNISRRELFLQIHGGGGPAGAAQPMTSKPNTDAQKQADGRVES